MHATPTPLDGSYTQTGVGTDAEVRRRLSVRSDRPGLQRLAVQVPLLVLSGVALVLADGWVPLVTAGLLHATLQATLFAPMHECSHGTAFATPWLQRLVAWFTGFFQLSAPAGMRAFHFAHHRHTHTLGEDPELAGTTFMAAWPKGPMMVAQLSGLPILIGRSGWLVFSALNPRSEAAWDLVMPFVRPAQRAGVARDARWMLLAHALAMLTAVAVEPRLWRVYAAIAVAHAILSAYIMVEHRGLPTEGDILARTRSFAGNRVVDWLMWNMPYHAEHHAWPQVPFHALPEVRTALEDRLVHRHDGLWAAIRNPHPTPSDASG